MAMYRVHAYVKVRVDEVIEAATAEEAVRRMYSSVLTSEEIRDRVAGQSCEYAEDFDDEMVVDELIEKDGKWEVEYAKTRTLRVTQL